MFIALQSLAEKVLPIILIGVLAWLFLASQRATRLRKQLEELASMVTDESESRVSQVWASHDEKTKVWTAALTRIQQDTEKIPDRLIRLNVKTQHQLSELFTGRPENLTAYFAKAMNGDTTVKVPTYKELYLAKIASLRKSISVFSFLER